MKKLFLYKLYRFDKRLFFAILSFSVCTLVFNLMGNEVTPFFVWGMYSAKESTDLNYQLFRIKVNDSVLVDYTAGYPDNNRYFLASPLAYYKSMLDHGNVDPALLFLKQKTGAHFAQVQPIAASVMNGKATMQQFPLWYKRYLEQSTGIPVRKLQVDIINARFDSANLIQARSIDPLFVWMKQ